MMWKSSKGPTIPEPGGASTFRNGPEPALRRLVRLVAEEGGVHAFIHRATADQGVVEEARALTRELLGGQDMPVACRQLCRRFRVDESLLRARLWAVASLFPDRQSAIAGPYQILGVEPWSGQDIVRRAFRALCRQWHPDHNQGDPEAATRFRQIKTAFDMVNDSSGALEWGPPPGVNAWDEPWRCEAREARPRLRRLTPLAAVVGLLVLAVGGADLAVHYLRPGFASRETIRTGIVPPDMKIATGEDDTLPGVREPLVLPGATSGQSAVGTVGQPAPPATVVGGDPGGAPGSAAQGTPSCPVGVVVRQEVAEMDEERGDDHASRVAAAHDKVAASSRTKVHETMMGLPDAEARLATFIASYVRDYSRRDLESFMLHFAPSALENGVPIKSLRLRYEEDFRKIPTMRYGIVVDSMSVGPDLVRFAGRCELRGLLADDRPIVMNGTLRMDLEPFGPTLRVRSLQYVFR